LGPVVYHVCRRFLGHTPDADDTFQVVFLVLARKAASVCPPGKVAAWVHGVAVLAARKARSARLRRARREVTVAELPDRPAPEAPDAEPTPAVDEEINRLPERFRLPVVLCELRGRSIAQVAAELGWPVGTVASRLSRGRTLLAARLARRGVTRAGVLVLAGGASRAASARVPESLVAQAVETALAPESAPNSVQSLASEVRRSMNHWKVQLLGVGLLAVVTVVGVASPRPVPRTTVPSPTQTDPQPIDRVPLRDLSGMLRQESIRKDIGLGPEQAKAIEEVRGAAKSKLNAKVEEVMKKMVLGQLGAGGGPPTPARMRPDPEQMTTLLNEHAADLEKQILAHLTPDQVRRLRQINLQVGGVASLLDRRVIRELQLSAGQEDQIDVVVRKRTSGIVAAEDVERAAQKVDALLGEGVALLNPDQRRKWGALIGKALPTTDLVKAGPYSWESQAENTGGGVMGGMFGGRPPRGGVTPASPKKPD
jgi:RNA polymerase sigma-70 factor (ECF subfamily)